MKKKINSLERRNFLKTSFATYPGSLIIGISATDFVSSNKILLINNTSLPLNFSELMLKKLSLTRVSYQDFKAFSLTGYSHIILSDDIAPGEFEQFNNHFLKSKNSLSGKNIIILHKEYREIAKDFKFTKEYWSKAQHFEKFWNQLNVVRNFCQKNSIKLSDRYI